jgi:hypothetical protein
MPSSGMLRFVSFVKNQRLGGRLCWLLTTAKVNHSSPILLILMMRTLRLYETSVLTRAAWRNAPEDGILHSHRHDNFKSYIDFFYGEMFFRNVRQLLVTGKVVTISPILITQMMEALTSSEMSITTRATRRNIPGENILHSHHRENLQSYIFISVPTTQFCGLVVRVPGC